jgi:hypothetical protein
MVDKVWHSKKVEKVYNELTSLKHYDKYNNQPQKVKDLLEQLLVAYSNLDEQLKEGNTEIIDIDSFIPLHKYFMEVYGK